MGQVAFDTQEFVETLESAGLPKDQAKAISIAVRKSHEVADVATKRDLDDVRKEIDARFDKVDARFEKQEVQMQARFEKTDAQIADVRKDLSAEIADVRKDMAARFEKSDGQMQVRFEKTEAQIALVRKDVEHIATGLLLKLGGVIVVTISTATAVMKYL